MAAVNHNQRTRRALEANGYHTALVEHWNSFAGVRQDLFGVFDVLAVGNGETIGVQITSWENMSGRRKKIREAEVTPDLLAAGWRVQVWGWRKEKNRWTPTVWDVQL